MQAHYDSLSLSGQSLHTALSMRKKPPRMGANFEDLGASLEDSDNNKKTTLRSKPGPMYMSQDHDEIHSDDELSLTGSPRKEEKKKTTNELIATKSLKFNKGKSSDAGADYSARLRKKDEEDREKAKRAKAKPKVPAQPFNRSHNDLYHSDRKTAAKRAAVSVPSELVVVSSDDEPKRPIRAAIDTPGSSGSSSSKPRAQVRARQSFPQLSPVKDVGEDESESSSFKPRVKARDFPTLSPVKDLAEDESESSNSKPRVKIRAKQSFPMLSPVKDVDDSDEIQVPDKHTDGKGKGKLIKPSQVQAKPKMGLKKPIAALTSPSKPKPKKLAKKPSTAAAFPLDLSPLSKGRKARPARAVASTVLSSEEQESDWSSEAGSSGDGKNKQKSKAMPFPMSTQLYYTNDDENTPGSSQIGLNTDLDVAMEDYDDDALFPSADPSTLCPYCDAPLPASPTPILLALLEHTASHPSSHIQRRPMNPKGRKAPLAVFIGVCQRHRFENEELPEAERRGWPKVIDWANVRARVLNMEPRLRAIVEDLPAEESEEQQKDGPKKDSIFWMDVIGEIKKKGARAVVGFRGQMASFQKTQPGYYGEKGTMIIHQTLYDLFPPSSFNSLTITPLSPVEFIQQILVPEVGVRLIMEDLNVEMEEAVVVLRDSASYGVGMFPEDSNELVSGSGSKSGKGKGKARKRAGTDDDYGGDDEEMDVGDRIVMERARKRRRELETEEKIEDEAFARTEALRERSERRAAQKRKASSSPHYSDAKDLDANMQTPKAKSRPRPRPIGKSTHGGSSPASGSVLSSSPQKRAKPRPIGKSLTQRNIDSSPAARSFLSPAKSKSKNSDIDSDSEIETRAVLSNSHTTPQNGSEKEVSSTGPTTSPIASGGPSIPPTNRRMTRSTSVALSDTSSKKAISPKDKNKQKNRESKIDLEPLEILSSEEESRASSRRKKARSKTPSSPPTPLPKLLAQPFPMDIDSTPRPIQPKPKPRHLGASGSSMSVDADAPTFVSQSKLAPLEIAKARSAASKISLKQSSDHGWSFNMREDHPSLDEAECAKLKDNARPPSPAENPDDHRWLLDDSSP